MFTLLIFPNGRRADAVVLSSEPGRMRLAVQGRSDTVELNEVGGRWVAEGGIPVEFGAILAAEQVAVPKAERTMAAGVLPC
jgi:hypothetical protein